MTQICQMKYTVIITTILLSLVLAISAKEYGREFQLRLIENLFASGRTAGVNAYLQSFEEASGLDTSSMNRYESLRIESSRSLESACDSNSMLRQRVYTSGDLLGLVTIDMKSGGSLSQSEAEDEPFDISNEYASQTIEGIEYDIHPCQADYSANTRVFTNQAVQFNSCDDVREFYPNFSNSDGEFQFEEDDGVVWVLTYNTTVWGGSLSLDFVISYDSETAANSNSSPVTNGEFSFTIVSPDGDSFTSDQTEMGAEVYKYMLEDVGEDRYPCDPPVDIDDFFGDNVDENNNDNDNSSSSVLLVSSLAFIALLLC